MTATNSIPCYGFDSSRTRVGFVLTDNNLIAVVLNNYEGKSVQSSSAFAGS